MKQMLHKAHISIFHMTYTATCCRIVLLSTTLPTLIGQAARLVSATRNPLIVGLLDEDAAA